MVRRKLRVVIARQRMMQPSVDGPHEREPPTAGWLRLVALPWARAPFPRIREQSLLDPTGDFHREVLLEADCFVKFVEARLRGSVWLIVIDEKVSGSPTTIPSGLVAIGGVVDMDSNCQPRAGAPTKPVATTALTVGSDAAVRVANSSALKVTGSHFKDASTRNDREATIRTLFATGRCRFGASARCLPRSNSPQTNNSNRGQSRAIMML
jgi:hypothetical protein